MGRADGPASERGSGPQLCLGDLAFGTLPMLAMPAVDAAFREPDLIGAFGDPLMPI